MKLKSIYICSSCEFESTKWTGKCPSCSGWNTLVEDVINVGKKDSKLSKTPREIKKKSAKAVSLKNVKESNKRVSSGFSELDNLLGGGFVEGSLSLLSGEPGIGKSTLTLQVANNIAQKNSVLIISGEESVAQIANRGTRIKANSEKLSAINEFNLENILSAIEREKPDFLILDSIQVISSNQLPGSAGSVSQVRYCTEALLEVAKSKKISTILIGHVTKEGNLAGPRVLEHLVDTVLHLEGDRYQEFRIMRSAKNRFGSCNEIGLFQMKEEGMVEVTNPAEELLENRNESCIGSAISMVIEGSRPILVEVQALVSTTHFGYPKRTANGFDLNRLQILIAALEKFANLQLQNQDVFINVVGGFKIKDPAADLAICIAIASSLLKKEIKNTNIAFGEVGLTGNIRKSSQNQKRVKEGKKLGFEKIVSAEKYKSLLEVIKQI